MDHDYTSTYCLHGECGTCNTVRTTCKTCGTQCTHGCHNELPVDPPAAVHIYHSTACQHLDHDACKNACTVCHTPCVCMCHFEIATPEVRPSITCPRCGKTSWHPMDIKMGYCGFCHDWTSDTQS